MAMPSAMGVERNKASSDEYSVPQMHGRAPNSPDTGFHTRPVQNLNPNFAIESEDWRQSSNPIPATSASTMAAKMPVEILKRRSSADRRIRAGSSATPASPHRSPVSGAVHIRAARRLSAHR